MFIRICLYEIKNQFKSITFYAFIILTALFVFSQIGDMWYKYPQKPLPLKQSDSSSSSNGLSPYGYKPIENPNDMRIALYHLLKRAVEDILHWLHSYLQIIMV